MLKAPVACCVFWSSPGCSKAGSTPSMSDWERSSCREAGRERREAFRQAARSLRVRTDRRQPDAPHQADRTVIELVHYSEDASKVNLSDYLRERCHRDYSALSKLFSEVNGISIEKYFLAQRIERVKELLAYGDLTVSEIADKLRYSSVAHLSAQFRAQTGMSPTEFRRLKGRGLKPLDEV